MAWHYKLDGFYVFSMNSQPRDENSVDYYTKVKQGSEWIANDGTGVLIYPGANYTIIPSMRLANIRKGLEDYEYFVKLKNVAATLDHQIDAELVAQAQKALIIGDGIINSVYEWTKSRDALEDKRREVANIIVKIMNHQMTK